MNLSSFAKRNIKMKYIEVSIQCPNAYGYKIYVLLGLKFTILQNDLGTKTVITLNCLESYYVLDLKNIILGK